MADEQKGFGPRKVLLLVVLIAAATAAATAWVTTSYLFPRSFEPVTLSQPEQAKLEAKLKTLNVELQARPESRKVPLPGGRPAGAAPAGKEPPLEPQPYSEAGAAREVTFTERELNALIATNTDLASKVAIDLSPGLVSARILLPVDPDMPVLGGKTLKISAGLGLTYDKGRPVVVLKGVSLWGVPIPNAWLGNIKNVDLVQEFGDEGFWKAFAAGVDNIAVGDGQMTVKLKE